MAWKEGKLLFADLPPEVLLLKEATSWLKSALAGSCASMELMTETGVLLLRGLLGLGLVVPLSIGCRRPDDRSSPDVNCFVLEIASFRLDVTSFGLEIASFRLDVTSLEVHLSDGSSSDLRVSCFGLDVTLFVLEVTSLRLEDTSLRFDDRSRVPRVRSTSTVLVPSRDTDANRVVSSREGGWGGWGAAELEVNSPLPLGPVS